MYCRVSPHNTKLLLKHPVLIHRFLGADDEDIPPPPVGFLGRLFGKQPEKLPSLQPREMDDEGEADKAWHAIHYLLTGSAEDSQLPLGFILNDGQQIGNEEVGYGPARLFNADQVARIDSAIADFTEDEFKKRYAGDQMDELKVYPQIWGREAVDNFDYIWDNFVNLRNFIHNTRISGSSLILYIS